LSIVPIDAVAIAILKKLGAPLMPDSVCRADVYRDPEDSRSLKRIGPRVSRDDLVRSDEIADIVSSLRNISDSLESLSINDWTGGAAAQESDFWLDNDHVYIDVSYAETHDVMMDICVQGGRAFIRVSREGLGAELVEMST
jgi:hypothetical protein